MQKNFIAIGVKSIDRSIDFYQKILNFKLNKTINPAANIKIAWLINKDNFMIELIQRDDMPKPDNINASVTLCFTVKDLKNKKKMLDSNSIKYSEFSPENGPRMLRFNDTDNTGISFISDNL